MLEAIAEHAVVMAASLARYDLNSVDRAVDKTFPQVAKQVVPDLVTVVSDTTQSLSTVQAFEAVALNAE